MSDADAWLNTTATSVSHTTPEQQRPNPYAPPPMMNGTPQPPQAPQLHHIPQHIPPQMAPHVQHPDPYGVAPQYLIMGTQPHGAIAHQVVPPHGAIVHQRAPQLSHLRSHSIDTADIWTNQQRAPTLRELSHHGNIAHFQSQQQNGSAPWHSVGSPPPSAPPTIQRTQQPDPFDAAWAAKSTRQEGTNPFQSADRNVTKAFEVKL